MPAGEGRDPVPLRSLIVDDSVDDYVLLVRELRRGGYLVESLRVDTEEAMSEALVSGTWDVVFSDWSMPRFGGMAALSVLRASGLDLPFIIVSGTIGEEVAVEALRSGAHDFLVKDRLVRLIPAVERELREAATRRDGLKMRDQLMVSDRMASVGMLAAGVAHEINNPLAAVIANLELANDDLERLLEQSRLHDSQLAQALREELGDARHAAARVRDIVRDLRIFARSGAAENVAIDVRAVIESALRMASNEIKHRARLVVDFEQVPSVLANEARLGQLFLNLIVNAVQAIPAGNAMENEIRVRLRNEGAWIRVDIEDTGIGIPPEVMKRLFMPFVTTKPVGIGTGLGLSICQRIVTECNGEIAAESRVGVGTTFVVRLPRSTTAVETRKIAHVEARASVRRGSVLVIDDEPVLAATIARGLTQDHDVQCVERARIALDTIRGGKRYDVIISDLMMPEMTGMEFHAALKAIAPDQAAAIVFLTGGAFTEETREFLERIENQKLEKPFEPCALRRLVNARMQ